MRWFAKPFSEIEYTKAGAVGCKTTTESQRGDDGDDDDDARGDASKRQRIGLFIRAVSGQKRTFDGQDGAPSRGKRKAGNSHNQAEGADVTNLKTTLLTLPWSTMEKIYTYEQEFSVQDIPSRDEMDQHLRRFAKERHDAPGMYHLYLVSDWWRTQLRANKGTRWLKQGNWRQLIYKSTCEDRPLPPGSEPDDHCAIHAIEGLVFARETYTSENGETVHVVTQVDDADGEAMVETY